MQGVCVCVCVCVCVVVNVLILHYLLFVFVKFAPDNSSTVLDSWFWSRIVISYWSRLKARSEPAERRPVGKTGTYPAADGKPIGKTDTYPTADGKPIGKTDTYPKADGKPIGKTDTYPNADGKPIRKTDTYPPADGKPIGKTDTYPTADKRPVRKTRTKQAGDLSGRLTRTQLQTRDLSGRHVQSRQETCREDWHVQSRQETCREDWHVPNRQQTCREDWHIPNCRQWWRLRGCIPQPLRAHENGHVHVEVSRKHTHTHTRTHTRPDATPLLHAMPRHTGTPQVRDTLPSDNLTEAAEPSVVPASARFSLKIIQLLKKSSCWHNFAAVLLSQWAILTLAVIKVTVHAIVSLCAWVSMFWPGGAALNIAALVVASLSTESSWERERENCNSNSRTLILKDSSVRSIWTYVTASPCYTTNTNKHGKRERERVVQTRGRLLFQTCIHANST